MDFLNVPVLGVSSLVFFSVLAGLFSARLGFSFLLVFLFAGVLAGEDGIGGYRFDNYVLSFWVGNLALAVILLDGGLRTAYATFRTGLRPAALLATVGVLVCTGITAVAAVWLFEIDWTTALLLGAIVGSTDAAAVFALLTRSGVTLNERVAATLEIESGVNDPMAVYLTVAFIALLTRDASLGSPVGEMAMHFVKEFGWGAAMGLAGGFAMAYLFRRVAPQDAGGGVIALLVCAAGLMVFSATGVLGGSGFLAIFLFGLILSNRAAQAVTPSLPAMDGYAWLAQAGMFLLLGMLVSPSRLLTTLAPSLGLALVLIFVARPLAVWLCLMPFRFSARETWFISWVGLRGAVPIVLALFPLLAGVAHADLLFNVAFVVVLTSLITQGSTIGWVARRLGVSMPDPNDQEQLRAVFRDFTIDPQATTSASAIFTTCTAPPQAQMSIAHWLSRRIGRPPIVGDKIDIDSATLVVRQVCDGKIAQIGMGLNEQKNPSTPDEPAQ